MAEPTRPNLAQKILDQTHDYVKLYLFSPKKVTKKSLFDLCSDAFSFYMIQPILLICNVHNAF